MRNAQYLNEKCGVAIKISGLNQNFQLLISSEQEKLLSFLKQFYMSFEDIKKQFNDLIYYLEKDPSNSELALGEMEKKDLENLLAIVIGISKRLYEKAVALEDETNQLQKIKEHNRDLQQQNHNLIASNQELTDIKTLYEEAEEKHRQTESISFSRINELEAQSSVLKNQRIQKINDYKTKYQNQSAELIILKNQLNKLAGDLDFLQKQLSSQKNENLKIEGYLLESQQQKQRLEAQIKLQRLEMQQSRAKNFDYQFNIFSKAEMSIKEPSLKSEANDAILQCSHEDDHQLLKNIQQSYDPIPNYQPNVQLNSPYMKQRQKSQISKPDSLKTSQKKTFLRRNTIQQKSQNPYAYKTNVKQYKPKVAFNSSAKLSMPRKAYHNKSIKDVLAGQRRSSGNSPVSFRTQEYQMLKYDDKSIKLPNILKQQVISIANSQEAKIEWKKKQIEDLKRKVILFEKQIKELQNQVLIKSDQISQLEGQCEMKADEIISISKQLQEVRVLQQKQKKNCFELKFTLESYKKKTSEQNLKYSQLKARYEKDIYELEDICQSYREELARAYQGQQTLKTNYIKLAADMNQLKKHNKSLETQIKNCFERIFQQEREEVRTYESPQRIGISKRSSLQNSMRMTPYTDRVMIPQKQEEGQQIRIRSNTKQDVNKKVTPQSLKMGLYSLVTYKSNQESSNEKDFQEKILSDRSKIEKQIENEKQNLSHQEQQLLQQNDKWPSSLNLNLYRINNPHNLAQEDFIEKQGSQNQSFLNVFNVEEEKQNKWSLKFFSNVYQLNNVESLKQKILQISQPIYLKILPNSRQICSNVSFYNLNENYSLTRKLSQLKLTGVFNQKVRPTAPLLLQAYTETIKRRQAICNQISLMVNDYDSQQKPKQQNGSLQFDLEWTTSDIIEPFFRLEHSQIQTNHINYNDMECQTYEKSSSECQTATIQTSSANTYTCLTSKTVQIQTLYTCFDNQNQCFTKQGSYGEQIAKVEQGIQFDTAQKHQYGSILQVNCQTDIVSKISIDIQTQDSVEMQTQTQIKLKTENQTQTQAQSHTETQTQTQVADQQNIIISSQQKQDLKPLNSQQSNKQTLSISALCSPSCQESKQIQSYSNSTQISPKNSKMSENNHIDEPECQKLMLITEEKEVEEERRDYQKEIEINVANENTQHAFQEEQYIRIISSITGKKLNLVKQQETTQYPFFSSTNSWNCKKLYILQAQSQNAMPNKLIFWTKGLIQIPSNRFLVAKQFGKVTMNGNVIIMGNSQVIVDKNCITTRRNDKRYFRGNIWKNKWIIKAVAVYDY